MDVSFDDAQRIGLETRTLRVDPPSGCHWRTGDRPALEILFFHNVAREMAQTMTDDMKDLGLQPQHDDEIHVSVPGVEPRDQAARAGPLRRQRAGRRNALPPCRRDFLRVHLIRMLAGELLRCFLDTDYTPGRTTTSTARATVPHRRSGAETPKLPRRNSPTLIARECAAARRSLSGARYVGPPL